MAKVFVFLYVSCVKQMIVHIYEVLVSKYIIKCIRSLKGRMLVQLTPSFDCEQNSIQNYFSRFFENFVVHDTSATMK